MSEQELLMKIANGEIKDKTKVKFDDDIIYEYWEEDKKLHGFSIDKLAFSESPTRLFSIGRLSNKVEVLEEDKEIEDTKYMRHHEGNGKCYIESKGHKYYVPYDLLLLIDDLVKELNELKIGK